MEMALRACTLWLWLDLRFRSVYGHVEEVLALRGALNDGIERQLGGNARWRSCAAACGARADQAGTDERQQPERALGDRGRDDLREAQQRRQPATTRTPRGRVGLSASMPRAM